MKKILALLLVLAMALSLVACGGKTEENSTIFSYVKNRKQIIN